MTYSVVTTIPRSYKCHIPQKAKWTNLYPRQEIHEKARNIFVRVENKEGIKDRVATQNLRVNLRRLYPAQDTTTEL